MLSRHERVFLYLAAVFVAALITCNLIALKFFETSLLGLGEGLLYPIGRALLGESFDTRAFQLSVGILPYPITFLVTDIICEIYGKERANQVVKCGLVASLFTLGALAIASSTSAIAGSPVDDDTFHRVFAKAPQAIFASMVAYLLAQLIDIRLFHFWKKLTKGKHLWLRNNGSTILSQLVDTVLVITLLFWNDASVSWTVMKAMMLSGFLFKVLCAFLDTPLFYLAVFWLKPWLTSREAHEVPSQPNNST